MDTATRLRNLSTGVLNADTDVYARLTDLKEEFGIPDEQIEELEHLIKTANVANAKYWMALNDRMVWYKRAWFKIRSTFRRIYWRIFR